MGNRRSFLQQSSALIGGSVMLSAFDNKSFAAIGKIIAPSDRVNIGAIGLNGMGWADLQAALKVPGVNVVALCDIDKNVLDTRMNDLKKLNVDTSKITTY